MAIEFPGYGAEFSDSVYSRKGKVVTDVSGRQIQLTEILIPKRFTQPTEEEVIDLLKTKAQEIRGRTRLILPDGIQSGSKRPLESVLESLPATVISDIATGDADCIGFIRKNTAVMPESVQPKLSYAHISFGYLPEEFIEMNRQGGEINNYKWFVAAMVDPGVKEAGSGKRWHFKLLTQEGNLPDRAELDVLLKHLTHGSRTFDISRIHYDPVEVADVIDSLYSAVNTSEKLSLLEDLSANVIEEAALNPVLALRENVGAILSVASNSVGLRPKRPLVH